MAATPGGSDSGGCPDAAAYRASTSAADGSSPAPHTRISGSTLSFACIQPSNHIDVRAARDAAGPHSHDGLGSNVHGPVGIIALPKGSEQVGEIAGPEHLGAG